MPLSRPTRPPAPPPAWRVPAWLVAPVLTVAIPDSPFGWGHRGAEPPSSPTEPPGSEPVTVGFAEPEETAIVPSVPPGAAESPPLETAATDVATAAPEAASEPDAN